MSLVDELEKDSIVNLDAETLERYLLFTCSVDSEISITEYRIKIAKLYKDFLKKKLYPEEVDEIYNEMPSFKYLSKEEFRDYVNNYEIHDYISKNTDYEESASLTDILNTGKGDCVALTSLFSIFALRQGLNVSIMDEPRHVYSKARIGSHQVLIENTSKDGFEARKEGDEGVEKPLHCLISIGLKRRGDEMYDKQEFEQAVKFYEKSIELEPDNANALVSLSALLWEKNDLEESAECCEKYLKLQPGSVIAWNTLGRIKSEMGENIEAIDCFIKGIKLEPDNANAWHDLGDAWCKIGELETAVADYEKAVQLKPDDLLSWKKLNYLSGEVNDLEKVMKSSQEIIKLEDDNIRAWNNLGVAKYKTGEIEEGIHYLRTAVKLNPEDKRIRQNLAAAKTKANKTKRD